MPSIPSKIPSASYKAIPDPVPGDDSLYHAVVALKEVSEVLTRQRKPLMAAAVTFQDLKGLGITDAEGRGLQNTGTLLRYLAALLGSFDGTLIDAVNDAAAATAGVSVGQLYRNGSIVMIRVA